MPSFAVPEGWPRKSKGRRQQKEATVSRYQMMCILVSVRSLSDLPQRFRSMETKGRIKGGREIAGFNSGLNQQLSDVKSARPQGLEGVPTCRTGLVPRWSEMDRYISFPEFSWQKYTTPNPGKGAKRNQMSQRFRGNLSGILNHRQS